MKTIGLVGGMSWESTAEYYRIINEAVKARLGGFHSARCVLFSLDFADIECFQHQGKWETASLLLQKAARRVEKAGADILLICANTMHKVAAEVQKAVRIPLLNIIDVTADEIKRKKVKTIGLLGTRFTMEQDFYKMRLAAKHGLQVLIPEETERAAIHEILYNELCLGKLRKLSRQKFRRIISRLVNRGAEGIILGCTEIPLLIDKDDYDIPLFDTTEIHALAAVDFALK
ncbi:MAG: aspartate/glutamate racemase family protein [Acidobacteriota bacterium]